MSLREMLEPFVIFGGMVAIACGVIAMTQSAIARLRPKKQPAAKWQVTIYDLDSMPMRSESMSIEGVARLISNISSGLYK